MSTTDPSILVSQSQSLVYMLQDLADAKPEDDPNAPNSDTQKRWACLEALHMHLEVLTNAFAESPETAQAEPDEPPTRDRAYLTRSAMSHLLMASMEMHTASGRTDAAYVLTEKALANIGALRDMTNGGRVQP